jgi:SIR2-like domain
VPNYILLTGAGFSRNWGGWLADEAFEYLISCHQIDGGGIGGIRDLLWSYKPRGGFEAALAFLQEQFKQNPGSQTDEQQVTRLESALLQMFGDMDKAFAAIPNFEFHNQVQFLIRTCFVRFDAIFTLNQDLLMERHYLNGNIALSSQRSWTGWQIPGMQPLPVTAPNEIPRRSPDPRRFVVEKNLQPFFKLHGSSNWIDTSKGRHLLVMGGNKLEAIKQHPILEWNSHRFREYLSQPDTRLMVIGYSFRDDHINSIIGKAVDDTGLHLFIIDPRGVDVLDKNRGAPIYIADNFFLKLQPQLIGASRRLLSQIFGGDLVEHGKVMRFFE